MDRKFSLDNALINKESFIIEGKYGFDESCEDLLFNLKVIAFEKMDYKLFYNNRLILNSLKKNDIFILICEILNMKKKKAYSFHAYPFVILKDKLNNHYYPWGDFDNFNNTTSDYFEERGLYNLQSAWIDFPPAVTLKGVLSYLLPKSETNEYFLSVTYEDEDHYVKEGAICTEKEYNKKNVQHTVSDEGWIYALVNPSMPNTLVKIGMTTRDVEMRVNELSSKTAVPTPFQIIYRKEVSKCKHVEAVIHSKLRKYRYQKNREFFDVSPSKLVPFLEKVCSCFPKKNVPTSSEIQTQKSIDEIETQIEVLQKELKRLKEG